jgi:hypothetical protein
MTEQEKEELLALSKRAALDSDDIEKWLDEFNMKLHPEARLVYFLGHLMNLGHDEGLI